MSAIILFTEEITLTLPEIIGIGSSIIILIGLFIKIFVIINARDDATDEKIGKAKEIMHKRINQIESEKVDKTVFEEYKSGHVDIHKEISTTLTEIKKAQTVTNANILEILKLTKNNGK